MNAGPRGRREGAGAENAAAGARPAVVTAAPRGAQPSHQYQLKPTPIEPAVTFSSNES